MAARAGKPETVKPARIIQTLAIPEGVSVSVANGSTVTLKSSKGTLERTFKSFRIKLEA